MGIKTLAIYSDADADSLHVREADEAVALGGNSPGETYLSIDKIMGAAKNHGATILHPGYGFLSENAEFAERVESAGIAFAGPSPQNIRCFGLKNTARELAQKCGIPLLPGTSLLASAVEAEAAAKEVGLPVMLKSTAGGGGIGMQVCRSVSDVGKAFEAVSRLGAANFAEAGVFLEKFVEKARHVEVQIFGDGLGNVIPLGERDCSTQRRNQKLIEETPAPNLSEHVRDQLAAAAVKLGRFVNYRSAGTVEFLYDAASESFYFLEVNTRLQVEHGVTEEVYGIDLVEWMLRLALGEREFFENPPRRPAGVAIQARIYAEMPSRNFQPSTGQLTCVRFPPDVRVETWVSEGLEISPYYDPMIAKIVAHAGDRATAVNRLRDALRQTALYGVETNQSYLGAVLETAEFREGRATTSMLASFEYTPLYMEVLEGGLDTIVVDWPGRVGYWNVGVPPSGPFDDRSFRSANSILGNPPGTAGLEITVRGPTLKPHIDCVVCLTGAKMSVTVDEKPAPWGEAFVLKAGSILKIGTAQGPGLRAYLCIKDGFDVAEYLGSRTTFALGQFGGHCGRSLRAGDALRLFPGCGATSGVSFGVAQLPDKFSNHWTIAVSYGPHGAPDFFTEEDIDMFFSTAWEVHYNSSRTGVRLIGPKPKWARADGGEAGLHPSNIHDTPYQVGAVDFTGDMPIILGPDGPSLGGFVCPATVLQSELWKVGQLRPGDRVVFRPVEVAQALELTRNQRQEAAQLPVVRENVFGSLSALKNPKCVIRRQGDTGLLVEFGEMVLDLELRFYVQALMEALQARNIDGVLDLTPGIRSLQVRYDPAKLSWDEIQHVVRTAHDQVGDVSKMIVPTRIVHLPLSWEDDSVQLAIDKYTQSVRADAPWCPSNIEFIRRINGLGSVEDVKRIVFSASYLVMGLGDVYLGAPVATPLDPRHRLVTTKYNPARTWTPENAVGIGGAYLCIYGMEGPGGYQLVGRTVPVWNRYQITKEFQPGQPWLLRFFDQIRFFPVDGPELARQRRDLISGRYSLRIEETEFSLAEYKAFLKANSAEIAAFKSTQQRAFEQERARWNMVETADMAPESHWGDSAAKDEHIPAGCIPVHASVSGNVWRILANTGDRVSAGDTILILESMKTEIPVPAGTDGRIEELRTAERRAVRSGQVIAVIRSES